MALISRELEGTITIWLGIALLAAMPFCYFLLKKQLDRATAVFEQVYVDVAAKEVSDNTRDYLKLAHASNLRAYKTLGELSKILLTVLGMFGALSIWHGWVLRNSIPIKKDAGRASPEIAVAE